MGVMPQGFHRLLEDIRTLQKSVKTCDGCLINLEAWASKVFKENFQISEKLGQCSERWFLYLTFLLSMKRFAGQLEGKTIVNHDRKCSVIYI